MTKVKPVPSLNRETANRIFLFSGVVFIIIFLWQYFLTTNVSYGRFDSFTMVILPMVYSLIAACGVGITLYVISKFRYEKIAARE